MKAIFISDIHLKSAGDQRYINLLNFFDEIKNGETQFVLDSTCRTETITGITDIFIAGDLFDFWFCNKDKIYPDFIPIIYKMVELQKAGIHIHLCEGNHDFFLREYFHSVLGMEVFEEWAEVSINGMKTLIGHGDTTDKTNYKYRLLRKILRSRVFYHFQRLVPARVRWTLANLSSVTSKEMTVDDGDVLVDKMLTFAVDKFREGYDAVIVGHCHMPVLRHYTGEGRRKTFIALGDWVNHNSFAYLENKNFYLSFYRPRPAGTIGK